MFKTIAVALVSLSLVACSDDLVQDDSGYVDAADPGSDKDVDPLADTRTMDAHHGDAATVDTGTDGGNIADAGPVDMSLGDMPSTDMSHSDMYTTDMSHSDMCTTDMDQPDTNNTSDMSSNDTGTDMGVDTMTDMSSTDTGSGGYDTTGWNMKRWTKSGSASTGTPDSYFFDVDAGSPMAASITGGGSGTWSVNVFGGMTNTLYCTGTPGCQVMLDPQDTIVVVTTITTSIGSYTLAVDYAGQGPR